MTDRQLTVSAPVSGPLAEATRFLRFEFPEGAAAGEPAGDPAGEPAGEPAWTGPSQEDWTSVQETMALVREAMQPREPDPAHQPEAGQQPLEIPDPYADPEGFANWLDERTDQRIAPYSEFVQRQEYQEGEQRGMDIIADLESGGQELIGKAGEGQELEMDSRKVAYELARVFFPEAQAKHGPGNRAAEAALERAVGVVRQLEGVIGEAYHQRKINELRTLGQAPRDLGGQGPAGSEERIARGGDELDLARRFVAERGIPTV